MQLTPQQQQQKTDLEQGIDYPLVIPGLTDVVAHIQDDNTWLKFTDVDGKHHYQLKGYAQKNVGNIEATFNWRIHRHSNGEVLTKGAFTFQEYDYWPFALANPPQGIVAFGYQQAINGLLRRLPALGGNEQQFGPSLFTFIGTTITLLHFEVNVLPESVLVDENGDNPSPQGDGEISITVTHGDAPYEYQITRPNAEEPDAWQDEDTFGNLSAGEYFVRVRDKAGVPIGAPTRYRTVTVPSVETQAAP